MKLTVRPESSWDSFSSEHWHLPKLQHGGTIWATPRRQWKENYWRTPRNNAGKGDKEIPEREKPVFIRQEHDTGSLSAQDTSACCWPPEGSRDPLSVSAGACHCGHDVTRWRFTSSLWVLLQEQKKKKKKTLPLTGYICKNSFTDKQVKTSLKVKDDPSF